MLARTALTEFVLLCASSPLFAQGALRIEIDSTWSGLGSEPAFHELITDDAGKFTANGRKVSSTAVGELLEAMDAPAVEQASLTECRADHAWREANVVPALQDWTHRKLRESSQDQIQLFKANFVEEPGADIAFNALLHGWHTDDYPKLSVRVSEGNHERGVESTSQNPFMLPWAGTDRARGGYSCRLSRAIAALLPKGVANVRRLIPGTSFRWELTEQVMDGIRQQWDALDAQRLVGPDIAPILTRFSLMKSAVSNLSSIDLDGRQSWNAEITSKELPGNLYIGVSLLYRGHHLDGVDTFLNEEPHYAALVLSIPWLRSYLETLPTASAELRYANGRSLSAKASQDLAQDLRLHGKSALAGIIERDAETSAFLEINSGQGCWSGAVVLPNRDVLLWHFKCDSVLGFPATRFKTWDFYGWHSTGTVIAPNGTIID